MRSRPGFRCHCEFEYNLDLKSSLGSSADGDPRGVSWTVRFNTAVTFFPNIIREKQKTNKQKTNNTYVTVVCTRFQMVQGAFFLKLQMVQGLTERTPNVFTFSTHQSNIYVA